MSAITDLVNMYQLMEMMDAPSEREKFEYKQQLDVWKQRQQGQLEMYKFTVGELDKQVKNAGTRAEREQLLGVMKDYYGKVPEVMRPALAGLIKTTELDPFRSKQRDFFENNPAPKAPNPEDVVKYPLIGVEYAFAMKDYKALYDNQLLGVPMPQSKSGTVGLGPDLIGYRNPAGFTTMLPKAEATNIAAFEAKGVKGKDYLDIVASGGRHYSPDREINIDGNISKERTWTNVFDEKDFGVERVPQRVSEQRKDLNEFLSVFGALIVDEKKAHITGDLGNLALSVKRSLEEGDKSMFEISQELKKRFGVNFALNKKRLKTKTFGGYLLTPDMRLDYFPGDLGFFGEVPVFRHEYTPEKFVYLAANGAQASPEIVQKYLDKGLTWTTQPTQVATKEEKTAWESFTGEVIALPSFARGSMLGMMGQ